MAICASGKERLLEAIDIRRGRVYLVAKNQDNDPTELENKKYVLWNMVSAP